MAGSTPQRNTRGDGGDPARKRCTMLRNHFIESLGRCYHEVCTLCCAGSEKGSERRASPASFFYSLSSFPSHSVAHACGWKPGKKCINFPALIDPNRCPPGEGHDSPSVPHVPLSFDTFRSDQDIRLVSSR